MICFFLIALLHLNRALQEMKSGNFFYFLFRLYCNQSISQSVRIYYIANLNLLQSFNTTKTTVVTAIYWSHHCFIMMAGRVSYPILHRGSNPEPFGIHSTPLTSSLLF